jgi:hypothetical protein
MILAELTLKGLVRKQIWMYQIKDHEWITYEKLSNVPYIFDRNTQIFLCYSDDTAPNTPPL